MPSETVECLLRQLDESLTDYFQASGQYEQTYNELAASGTSGQAFSLLTLDLSPGTWDVEGNLIFVLTNATTTVLGGAISADQDTISSDNSAGYIGTQHVGVTSQDSIALVRKRFVLAVTTTIHLNFTNTYSSAAGSVQVLGRMTARKVL